MQAAKQQKVGMKIKAQKKHVRTYPLPGMLRYVSTPTMEKFLIDLEPLLYKLVVPSVVWQEQMRELKKIEKAPAKADELFQFLKSRDPESLQAFRTVTLFDAFLQSQISSETLGRVQKIPYKRLSAWLSKEGSKARDEYYSARARVCKLRYLEKLNDGWRGLFFAGLESECACVQPGEFYRQVEASVLYHDANELPENRNFQHSFGEFCTLCIHDSFLDRNSNFLLVGRKGSGKSTVTNVLLNLLAPLRFLLAFKPAWDDNFPFTGYISELCICFDMNDVDFRSLNKGTLKNLMELCSTTKLAQKGGSPVEAGNKKRSLMTVQKFVPVGQWDAEDMDAVLDRCYRRGFHWDISLPDGFAQQFKQDAAQTECANCSARLIRSFFHADIKK